jgi:metal-responsive CopG/Arc/MetJ family transcriptional regulator
MDRRMHALPPSTARTSPHHVAVRLDAELLARIDALVPGLSSQWHGATRSDALRHAIVEGLRAIDARKSRQRKGSRS